MASPPWRRWAIRYAAAARFDRADIEWTACALMLDSFFALHRRCRSSREYRENHAAVIHAVATSYRDRSHFEGQTCSKAALPVPAGFAIGCSPRAGSLAARRPALMSGLAIGPTTPLVLRGAAPTVGLGRRWHLPQKPLTDTAMRLVELYNLAHPALASALSQGLQLDSSPRATDETEAGHQWCRRDAAGGARRRQADVIRRRPPDAALAFDAGIPMPMKAARSAAWRSCCQASTARSRNFESGLGERWAITVVVVATEFGRTARITHRGHRSRHRHRCAAAAAR